MNFLFSHTVSEVLLKLGNDKLTQNNFTHTDTHIDTHIQRLTCTVLERWPE